MYEIYHKFKVDFKDLEGIPQGEKLPILSFLGFFKRIGLVDLAIQKGLQEVCSLQQIFCNFSTFQKIRNLIKFNWEHYYLDILSNNKVVWKEEKTREKLNYSRTLSKKIKKAISLDFANYSLSIKDELEDGEILFTNGEAESNVSLEAEVISEEIVKENE